MKLLNIFKTAACVVAGENYFKKSSYRTKSNKLTGNSALSGKYQYPNSHADYIIKPRDRYFNNIRNCSKINNASSPKLNNALDYAITPKSMVRDQQF